ncbi:hypothetical protein BDR04DRAFT_1122127 [Suillus decipiens]|nr:hypothetical protein BDR04DRAFT_1122127 [Suillus decipiens]
MGVSGSLIEHFYEEDSAYQRPVVEPPEAITEVNFIEHLGDENFYVAYKAFFSKIFKERGLSGTLEEYVFSKKYNFMEERDASTQPVMFERFLGDLFHAFIHVGYGAEMGIPGMVVEDHARLEIRAQGNREAFSRFDGLMSEHGDAIWRHAEQWTIDPSQPGEIERKIDHWRMEQGQKLSSRLLLLASGHIKSLSSIPVALPVANLASSLLRGYFASTLGWWVARGFPSLDIQGFFNATSHLLSDAKVANPFLDIIQRAFTHFSSLYGARSKGYFKDTELEGAESLDGSLFLRAARLTEEYMSEGTRPWSQEGFLVRE